MCVACVCVCVFAFSSLRQYTKIGSIDIRPAPSKHSVLEGKPVLLMVYKKQKKTQKPRAK